MAEKICFPNTRKQKLYGIVEHPDKGSDCIVLIAHGYYGDKSGIAAVVAKHLAQQRINSLRFDFAGSGESDGQLEQQTITGYVDDLIAAANLMESRGFRRISVFGNSLGGLAALAAARKRSFKALCLWAPVVDLPEQMDQSANIVSSEADIQHYRHRGFASFYWKDGGSMKVFFPLYEDSMRYQMLQHAKSIDTPTLILHGTKDEGLDSAFSKKLSELLPRGKFILVKDADHLMHVNGSCDGALQQTAAWFRQHG